MLQKGGSVSWRLVFIEAAGHVMRHAQMQLAESTIMIARIPKGLVKNKYFHAT